MGEEVGEGGRGEGERKLSLFRQTTTQSPKKDCSSSQSLE